MNFFDGRMKLNLGRTDGVNGNSGYLRVNCSSPATQVDFCSGNEA